MCTERTFLIKGVELQVGQRRKGEGGVVNWNRKLTRGKGEILESLGPLKTNFQILYMGSLI